MIDLDNNIDLMEINQHNIAAAGGTELIQRELYSRLPRELLQQVQIWFSRYVPDRVDWSRRQVFFAHDLPEDPETEFLANGGWSKFHILVFVSNWQMRGYIQRYNIPWSKCIVMPNAITPIPAHEKPTDKINLVYFSTPHRGLNILVPVFKKLYEELGDKIHLNVYSSFKLYGWPDRDTQFKDLFDECRSHPGISYNESVPNADIREMLKDQHILAYPNIWEETSCLVLIESMSAGLVCVHPNYGALPETASRWTAMYQWNENPNSHASVFYQVLKSTINSYELPEFKSNLGIQKMCTDVFHNWTSRSSEWEALLTQVAQAPLLEKTAGNRSLGMISYKAG